MDWDEFDHYGRMNWRLNGDLNGLGQGDYCCEVKVLCEEEKGWRYQEKQRGGVCVWGGDLVIEGWTPETNERSDSVHVSSHRLLRQLSMPPYRFGELSCLINKTVITVSNRN